MSVRANDGDALVAGLERHDFDELISGEAAAVAAVDEYANQRRSQEDQVREMLDDGDGAGQSVN